MDKPATPLPCPFCGGGAMVRQYQYQGTGASGMETPEPYIRCAKCGAEQPRVQCDDSPYGRKNNRKTYVEAKAEAIAAWNRRVPDPTAINAELVACLEALAPELRIMAEWTHSPLSDEYAEKYRKCMETLARAKEASHDAD